MYVRSNLDLDKAAIDRVIAAAIDQASEHLDDKLAHVTAEPTVSPLDEPANLAVWAAGAGAAAQSALDRCDVDAAIAAGVGHGEAVLGRSATFDEREQRRLARGVYEGIAAAAESAEAKFARIGSCRAPAGPVAIERGAFEVEADAEVVARLRSLKQGDNVGDLLDVSGTEPTECSGDQTTDETRSDTPPASQALCLTSPAALMASQAPWPLKRADWLFSALWDEFTKFQVEGRRWKPNEAKAAESTRKLVLGILGDRKLSELDSDDMGELRRLVLQLPAKYAQAQPWRNIYDKKGPLAVIEAARCVEVKRVSDKTWDKHYSRLSPFSKYARSQNGKALLPSAPNPMDGLFIKLEPDLRSPAQARSDWRLYNGDELVTFFTSPKVLGCKSSSRWKDAGDLVFRDARYWLLLIGFLHGNRREEPTILRVRHVRRCPETGIWYFNWAPPELRSFLKDVGSPRDVPLHWKLLALGFIEARVEGRNPDEPLFPEADSDAEILRRAGPFGQWFHEFRLHCGIDNHDVDFHASRHTVIMLLLKIFTPHLVEAVVGHWSEERRSALRAYTHAELLVALKPVVDAIDMPIDVALLMAAVKRSDDIDRAAAWPDLKAPRKWARTAGC